MIWRFSDGTVAKLGGVIEGTSIFARELWADLAQDWVGVDLYGGPGGGVELDRNNPALFDAWLKQEMERGYRRHLNLSLIERPEGIPELPPDPREFEFPEGSVV